MTNDGQGPPSGWSTRVGKNKTILLKLEYLEVQEGLDRAYGQTIQLGLNRGMCQELGEALLKVLNSTRENLPPGTQLFKSRER